MLLGHCWLRNAERLPNPMDADRTSEEEAYMLRNLGSSAAFEPWHRWLLTAHPFKSMWFSPCCCCHHPSPLPWRQHVPELWLENLQQLLPMDGGISNLPNVCIATLYSSSSARWQRRALAVFHFLHSLIEARPDPADAHPYVLALQGQVGASGSRSAAALSSAPQ